MIKKFAITILVIIFVAIVFFGILLNNKNTNMVYGVSFSPIYTQYLGYDYKEVYRFVVDDMGFRYIRLMAQWDDIERIKGEYDFSKLDWLMDYSAKNNVKVVLAIGRKTPRWPECHLPSWVKNKEYSQYKKDLQHYMKKVVNRYKSHTALEIWQVENEPFLAFGLCDVLPEKDLQEEIELVNKIDSKHKILITDSGELSTWRKTARAGDLFGTTMYRVVWNKRLGYFSYNWLPSFFYKAKLKLTGRSPSEAYIVELQAEPWLPDKSVHNTELKEQYKSMNEKQLKKNIEYAAKTGMSRSYLWGVEWWYWMQKEKGISSYVDYVKTLKM